MNKAALIEAVAEQTGVNRKHVELVIDSLLHTITKQMQQGESVNLTSFGKFSPRVRAARLGVDPQDPKKKIEVPAVTVPKFKAGKGLKESLKRSSQATPETPPTTEA